MFAKNDLPTTSLQTVPVIALSGFLGAGKTTILNDILAQIGGEQKIGVIVNDFGEVGVDALLVSGSFTEPVELANGCLCCYFDENGLKKPVLDLLAAGCDAIFIEASGLAEPKSLVARMFEVIKSNPQLSFGGLIYVLDGKNYQTAERDFAFNFYESLDFADLVVVTKAEEITGLDDVLSKKRVIFAPESHIDARFLVDSSSQDQSQYRYHQMVLGENPHNHAHPNDEHEDKHHHLHEHFTEHTEYFDAPLDKAAFIKKVKSMDVCIWRAKGPVCFKDDETWYIFQKVGEFIDIKPLPNYAGKAFLTTISLA